MAPIVCANPNDGAVDLWTALPRRPQSPQLQQKPPTGTNSEMCYPCLGSEMSPMLPVAQSARAASTSACGDNRHNSVSPSFSIILTRSLLPPGTISPFLDSALTGVRVRPRSAPAPSSLRKEYPVAPRPYWKGYLKLSLVSCLIALHTATSGSGRVAFRQINKVTGNRLRQQLVDEVTREPVDAADKGRGYEYAKGQFIQVEDEEIDAVAIESNHTIEIDKFVPHAGIDERYFDSTYYITPNEAVGQEAFAVIRDAMRGKEMVALGRVVLAKRERVIMLQPWEKGLMGTTLRYAYEVRPAAEYFDEIPDLKISKEMLQLAEHILETKEAEFDPTTFVDEYETAVVEMLQKKSAGIAVPTEKAAEAPRNVINLMDALRRSVEGGKRTPAAKNGKAAEPKAAKGAAKKGKKTAAGQREMLLPIAGKGQGKAAKEAARESAKPAARRKAG